MYKQPGYLLLAVLGVAATGLPLPAAEVANEGDVRSIKFVLPFDKALETAKRETRLIFLKPIYGGVDQLGAKEYRCGNW